MFCSSLYLYFTNTTSCCLLYEFKYFEEMYCFHVQDRTFIMLNIFRNLQNLFNVLMNTCVHFILKIAEF
jgi:hypothetical protein